MEGGKGGSTQILLALALLITSNLQALDPDKAITQYVQDIWGREKGMPQLSARYITQTSDGYLWIGTENGLARFDGVRFTVFDPRNQTISKQSHFLQVMEDLNFISLH